MTTRAEREAAAAAEAAAAVVVEDESPSTAAAEAEEVEASDEGLGQVLTDDELAAHLASCDEAGLRAIRAEGQRLMTAANEALARFS